MECKECGRELVGRTPRAKRDGPLDVGEKIPKGEDHPHYDTAIGVFTCGCGRDIEITPRDWWEIPFEI